ncbi:hypothetical protein PVAP13_9KG495378 [Panicum virgatum]|uniref:Secreted protein n=1 Tax=Panicum virgatum TaxID=38727 RepID=A0A8T0NTT7_PANVG|nr:hypothetical protein PVAP13_9KG495378 [Panicum virgatum]
MGLVTVMAPPFFLTLLGLPFPAWPSDDLHYCTCLLLPLLVQQLLISNLHLTLELSGSPPSKHAEAHMLAAREDCRGCTSPPR